ncbi:MAG: serine/threonine-protein kinase RsbW [Thermoleophilaceae bacterium]|jgi:anti-sigma regulatory factor (Ser/Thr protein kinase)|nr:serine/threonine-protein kinase RsbW [Gaiellaceae bacterium]MEA2431860.1 serine/threonine-protein kinase RsbW [Thermoleophilaceae bacterium]MEA2436929.1 serine/threonine-protein kinase RsbW [Thermoleophilaceae bacterium]
MTVLGLRCRGSSRRDTHHQGLRLRHDPAELGRARAFADAAAERFGLDVRGREDFKLATSEAVANAIEHGLPCWDGAIHLWAAVGDTMLTLGVRNGGEFVFRPPPTDPLAERGRGLTVMAGLVDAVALSRIGDDIQIELSKERPDGNC